MSDSSFDQALVEALFPEGHTLPAPDSEQLAQQVHSWLAETPFARQGIRALQWWLDSRFLLRHGQRFHRADLEKRRRFLEKLSRSLIGGSLLRGLSIPYKTAYLQDEKILSHVNSRLCVQPPAAVEPQRWQAQITQARDCEDNLTLEADVVVIGSGAGGAAAAYELASRGLAVVIIEEGDYIDRRGMTGKLTEMIPRLYRASGLTGAFGSGYIPIPIGKNVGGTTTINSGTCLRTPDAVLSQWQAAGLTSLTPETLAPFFQQVEEILHVSPADPKYVGEIGKVIYRGASQLGLIHTGPLMRNAQGCDGQGLCQYGCPTEAKQSTNVSFIPRALDRGAFLFSGFRAEKLQHHNRNVQGVTACGTNSAGDTVTLTIHAPEVVTAMGTLLTPLWLKRNGVQNRWLGRNLSIHPCGAVLAYFPDREFDHAHTIPQGYGVHDYAAEGLVFEGGTLPFIGHGLSNSYQSDAFMEFIERYQHTAYFGFMIKDTSRGTVRRGVHPDVPFVHYKMNDRDFALFLKGIRTLGNLYFAAGAEYILLPGLRKIRKIHSPKALDEFLNSSSRRPQDFLITAYHPLGTARIAANASQGVCDEQHRVFGWQGLSVMDGAAIPSSLGANPQVTIMTLAMKAASSLADRILHQPDQPGVPS